MRIPEWVARATWRELHIFMGGVVLGLTIAVLVLSYILVK